MAKRRKKRTSPNISDEAIERARQQLGDTENTVQSAEPTSSDGNGQETESRQKRRRRERQERKNPAASEVVQYSQLSKRKTDDLDNETIERMLANPTKFVSEDELRDDYKHVITDLRSMGALATVLMVALIIMGQLI